jgi:hypothetical protein
MSMAEPRAPRKPDALAVELEDVLRRLTAEHERLSATSKRRRQAIARADAAAMGACMTEESEIAARIAAVEGQRESLVQRAIARFGRPADAPADWRPTLSWIAARLEEPDASRLAALAGALRELIERLRAERQAVRDAADALAGHMRGLIRAVEHRLSHSGAYGRRGVVAAGPAVFSALDLTT